MVSLFLASRRTEHIAFNAQICHLRGNRKSSCLPEPESFLFFFKKNYTTVCTHPQPTMFLQMGPQKILHSSLGTAGCNEVKGLEQDGKKGRIRACHLAAIETLDSRSTLEVPLYLT